LQKHYFLVVFYSSVFLLFIFGFYVINSRERLEEMAHFDFLTKLPNRSYFYIEFQRELKRAKRYKTKLALLFIDLDGFKAVNDTNGHKAGDQLLQEVALRIKKSIRDIDIVARLGGDEFVVLLPNISHAQESLIVANKIITSLNNEFSIIREPIFIGASIGIAIYPDHGEDIDELIKNADNIMYNVKNSNKNSAKIYNQESL
jgi:diguanylate cyclase (GGDEF)-like protein